MSYYYKSIFDELDDEFSDSEGNIDWIKEYLREENKQLRQKLRDVDWKYRITKSKLDSDSTNPRSELMRKRCVDLVKENTKLKEENKALLEVIAKLKK